MTAEPARIGALDVRDCSTCALATVYKEPKGDLLLCLHEGAVDGPVGDWRGKAELDARGWPDGITARPCPGWRAAWGPE